ncbi:MAG: hypothetical protein K8U03_10770 [Planctomycetia bacterium]|nr:hypothetical protein [Planctomycetia bacterium]
MLRTLTVPVFSLLTATCLLAQASGLLAQAPASGDEPGKPAAEKPEGAKAGPPQLGPAGEKRVGKYLRIGAPITDKVRDRVRRTVETFVDQAKKHQQWPVVILEIQSGRTEFGSAHDLAKYLSGPNLNGATTIAYVPKTLTGHGVLVALACNEIIIHKDGVNETTEIGDAGTHETSIDQVMTAGYRQIAEGRKTVPLPIALKMLDKKIELLQVETESSREFVLREDLEALKKRKAVSEPKVVIPAGRPGLFTGAQAQEFGFVGRRTADKTELLQELGLSGEALEEDPSIDGEWRTVRVDVRGVINAEMIQEKIKVIDDEIRKNDVNFICVWIDSPGGDFAASSELAHHLAKGLDPSKRRTVAYIAGEARGDAALIALACDQIVMLPDAELGGSGAKAIEDRNIATTEITFRDIAGAKFHSPTLAAAMVNPKLEVFRYTRRDNGLTEYFTEAEVDRRPDTGQWQQGEQIKAPQHNLLLSGKRADDLGLSQHVVADFAEFKALYHLEHDPQLLEQNLAMQFIAALNTPSLSLLLLLIGGAALYMELHTPGVGVGGFVAAVCFVLYFWSQHLGGTAGWLEALLFALGMFCVLIEIFVFPGVGIFGLGGGLLVITSLVLASQTFVIPRNDYQMEHLRTSLLVVVGAIGGTIATSAIMRRFLPHAPMFSRVLLAPPIGEELSELSRRESLGQFQHLLGARGTASTTLVPGGKARFGEQLVDVISEGEFIDRGLPIEVIEVQGTRVVVRQANA